MLQLGSIPHPNHRLQKTIPYPLTGHFGCPHLCTAIQVICSYYLRRVERLVPSFYAMLALHIALWLWETGGHRSVNPEAYEVSINVFQERQRIRQAQDALTGASAMQH